MFNTAKIEHENALKKLSDNVDWKYTNNKSEKSKRKYKT